jgi:hypothetical protein
MEKTSKKTLKEKEATPKVIAWDTRISFSEALWNLFEAVCEVTQMTRTQFAKMAIQRELQNQLQVLNFFRQCAEDKLWEEALGKTKELVIVHGSKPKGEAKTQSEAKAQGVV